MASPTSTPVMDFTIDWDTSRSRSVLAY
jgi:hypothetical protein